ncbi:MAG: hypothetical protein O3A51_03710 [Verrucomicrobia bacterium]|nr:hypothetical protein [Verrucomicrobiota bacterium]
MSRIPAQTRPFFEAALLDTIGLGAIFAVVIPFHGVIARRLGASPELLGLLAMAPFIGFLLAAPASRLAFAFHWGKLTGGLRVLGGLLLLVFAFIDTAVPFVWLVTVAMMVGSVTQVFFHALLKAHVRQLLRPVVLPWLRIIPPVLALASSWFAGRLLDAHPLAYRWLYPLAGLICIGASAKFFGLPRRSAERVARAQTPRLMEEWHTLWGGPTFALLMIVFFIGALGEKISMPILPIYFADILDLTYAQVAVTLGVVGPLLAIIGYWIWGELLKRWTPMRVITVCMLIKVVRPICWAMATGQASPVAWLMAGEGVFRLMIAGLDMGIILAVLQVSKPGREPVYVGIHYAFMGLRGVLGPVLGILLYRGGMAVTDIYWLTAATVGVGGIALAIFARQRVRQLPRPPQTFPAEPLVD